MARGVSILCFALALALGAPSGAVPHDSQAPETKPAFAAAKMTELQKVRLADEFTPGREIVVNVLEIPPHTTLERHYHPGEEFHYYLEGEVEIAIDGQPSIIGTPGTTGHVPYRALHTAITREKPAKVLVFRVHTAGEPVRYLEGEKHP